MIEIVQHDQRNILKILYFSHHTSFSTYDVIRAVILLFWLILPINRCLKHLNYFLSLVVQNGRTNHLQKYFFHIKSWFECITSWMTSFTRFSLILPLNYRSKHLSVVFTKSWFQLQSFNLIGELFWKNYLIHTMPMFWYTTRRLFTVLANFTT